MIDHASGSFRTVVFVGAGTVTVTGTDTDVAACAARASDAFNARLIF